MPPPAPETFRGDIDETTVTRVRCGQCNTAAKWKGPLTDDMLARTFTRGVSAETGLPNCPHCGTPMAHDTKVDAVEAFKRAADQLPADQVATPRQPRIPGLTPAFNFEAAFHSIIDQRAEVRRAKAIHESKHKDAQRAKKTADEAQDELSKLEDEYAERAEEREHGDDAGAGGLQGCAYERETGKPCTICPQLADIATRGKLTIADQVNIALEHARSQIYPNATDLAALVTASAGIYVRREDVKPWDLVTVGFVLEWLAAPTSVEKPPIMGRSHIVGELGAGCVNCGALLTPLAAAHGLEAWPVGAVVGIDCQGPPEVEEARPTAKRHKSRKDAAKAKQVAEKAERQAAAERQASAKPARKTSTNRTNGSGKRAQKTRRR